MPFIEFSVRLEAALAEMATVAELWKFYRAFVDGLDFSVMHHVDLIVLLDLKKARSILEMSNP